MTYSAELVRRNLPKNKSSVMRNKWVQYILCLFFGFFLSGSRILGICTFLGISYVSACGAGVYGLLSLIGSSVGYIWHFGFNESAEYIASAVVIYTIAFVSQYTPVYKKRLFMPITSSVVLCIALSFGAISTVRSELPIYLRVLLEVLGVFIMSYVYITILYKLKYGGSAADHEFVISLIFGISSLILSGLYIQVVGGISVGRVLSLLLLLIINHYAEPYVGCMVAVIFGLVIDVSGLQDASCLYYFVIYSLLSSLKQFKYRVSSATFIILYSGLFFAVEFFLDASALFIESIFASVIFILIPSNLLKFLRGLYTTKEYEPVDTNEYIGDRKDKIHDFISDIRQYLNYYVYENSETDIVEAFDQASERICLFCDRKDICWNNHQNELMSMFDTLINIAEIRGKLQTEDFPVSFCEYCSNSQTLMNEINYELRRKADNNKVNKLLNENRQSTLELLDIISATIKDIEFDHRHINEDIFLRNKVKAYLESIKCDCEVIISESSAGKLRIELYGARSKLLLNNSLYLDTLSQILNLRLRALKSTYKKDMLLLLEAELFTVSVGVASRKKKGERVCGDQCTYFKTEDGILYVILSDGLGAGEFAKNQSTRLIQLLERFLICDMSPLEALRLVNVIITLSNSDQWSSATIDLLSLNLYTGYTEIYKFGAAPSYVVTNDGVRMIVGNAMPVGLQSKTSEPPDVESFTMKPGEIIVMASDGVVIDNEELVQQRIYDSSNGMKNYARTILLESQKHNILDDDMTVLSIGLDYRK